MCPKCGSDNVQVGEDKEVKGFGNKKGLCGCCLFGPLGLLFGLCGMGKSKSSSYRMCMNCGKKF